MNCNVPIFWAYFTLIYILTSIFYLIITKVNGKTPLSDEIEKNPELIRIRNESKKYRSKVFYLSLAISVLIILVLNPLNYELNDKKEFGNKIYDIIVLNS